MAARNRLETIVKPFQLAGEDKLQPNSRIVSQPNEEGTGPMAKLLDLLYSEYTRSRMAEMEAANGFAASGRWGTIGAVATSPKRLARCFSQRSSQRESTWRHNPAGRRPSA